MSTFFFYVFITVISLLPVNVNAYGSGGGDTRTPQTFSYDWIAKSYPTVQAVPGDSLKFTWTGANHNLFQATDANCPMSTAKCPAAEAAGGSDVLKNLNPRVTI